MWSVAWKRWFASETERGKGQIDPLKVLLIGVSLIVPEAMTMYVLIVIFVATLIQRF
jgi:hypothetical protein